MKKVTIIIPVYNEAATLFELLNRVYAYQIRDLEREIIIVESKSTDGSREIAQDFSKGKADISLILEEKPQGKGHAVRDGLGHATGDVIIIQDADLEYDVNDYEKVLAPILEGWTHFVLGSRHLDDNKKFSWKIRKFRGKEIPYAYIMNLAGVFIHGFFNVLYGTKLTDPTTMYKVFSKELLDKVHFQGEYFELDWEMVCKFVRLGHVPIEVPVKYDSRSPHEGKKIKFFRDGWRGISAIVKYRFKSKDKL